jgi:outer membrane protein assembly factor BamB
LALEPLGNNHGASSSPILAGDLVVQVLGGDTGSRVIALDRRAGKIRWEAPLRAVTYSTPVVVTLNGKPSSIVVVSTGEAVGLNYGDGKKTWWLHQVPYQPKASPITSPDGSLVFIAVPTITEESMRLIASFDKLLQMWDVNGDEILTQAEIKERKGPAAGFPQLDLNGDGQFDREEHGKILQIANVPHLMAAIPTDVTGDATEKTRWTYRKSVPNVPSPLLYDGVFYAIKEGGIASALDAETGTILKEGRVAPAFGAVYSSPVAADGKIYVASQTGKLAVLRIGRDWEPLAVNDLEEECFATPAISGDSIIIRTAGHLWNFRSQP